MDVTPNPPDPLDQALNRWSATPEPSGNLTREVWRRIALNESPAHRREVTLLEQFTRPFFATVFVFGCAVIGLFLAEVRIARLQTEASSQLARSYVALINPLLHSPDPEGRK
jgi:hypothetical protein